MSSSSGATLNRTLTRVLRGKSIDAIIQCTSTLVACYNEEKDPKAREALRKWLEAYFYEFSQIRTGSISRKAIAEFVNLAKIKVREPADSELVRRVYATLSEIFMTKEGCSVYFILGLEHVLSTIDKEILQEDARSLIALADRLIEMTNPKKMPLTRDTFEYQTSCLHAFERVLTVLHDLEKDRSDNQILKYFEDKTKRHLDMIISCQYYYPFAYQALLIKEHLNALLTRDIKSNLLNAGRRAFYAFCGGLYIFQGVRELAVMKLDFNVMVTGIEKIQQAFKDIGWDILPDVQEIVLAASETIEQDDFKVFLQCYDKHKNVSWLEGLKWSKQRAIRYAFVSHLCLFCTEKRSSDIQEPAWDLLVKLVTKDEGKQWRNDKHIFEAMTEALVAIGKQNQDFEENVTNAFNMIARVQNTRQKKIIDECLNGMGFEERIKCGYKPQEDNTNRTLFEWTRQKLNLPSIFIYNQNQQALKDHYKTNLFAKVSLFVEESDQRHISTFDFNLVEYEKVLVSRDEEDSASQENYNQRENNLQRNTMVRKPISMMELFKRHQTAKCEFHGIVQHVLVIGNPGTGKTCLSKRICHDWASGMWGLGFTHVYLLPIRRLSDDRVGNCGDLSSIILRLVYHVEATQDVNKPLYREVRDNLSEVSTLLILDGYDEAGEIARDLVSSALILGCCLLILSRPHSVQGIRPLVSNEVECLEFSGEQLRAFVRKELEHRDANNLLEFLSENVSIEDTCRVAVNAQIIARLWKSSYKEEFIKSSRANLASFYAMILDYTWTRFISKIGHKFSKSCIFDTLERIAYESFQKGQTEIPEQLVLKHAQDTIKVFCASGFLVFVKEGTVFQFAHLTFHEYFTGCYLAKMLHSENIEERNRAEKVIADHKYIETSQVMFSFMTQCFCMTGDSTQNLEAFKHLMQIIESEPIPTIGFRHLLLKMRMLDAFLPCGLDDSEPVHSNDVVVQIVNDAMDALKRWFGYELGVERGRRTLVEDLDYQTLIVDELSRMSTLFNQFPDLLKPILLNEVARAWYSDEHRRHFARILRLNPKYAIQCILPMLDNWTNEEQASMIQLCAFIRPLCAEPVLDHLKRLLRDQDSLTQWIAGGALLAFIDLFPEREDVQQLMVDALRDPHRGVRFHLTMSVSQGIFAQETEAGNFVWDLLIEAAKDNDSDVRMWALLSCVQHYQTFAKSIDEGMELVREFAVSPNNDDRRNVSNAIRDLIKKAPEQSEELLVLLKALCADPDEYIQGNAVAVFLEIARGSYLRREDLFNMAFDIFKDGYPYGQVKLLPFLFSSNKEENRGIDEVNEWIASCQNLDEEVQEKVDLCCAANALLAKYTVEEIHDKFYDQDEEVQEEIVAQFDLREMDSNKDSGAIAEMAVYCLKGDQYISPSRRLLERLSKIELFPSVVLEKLAPMLYPGLSFIEQQPLSHLLKYYWTTKDPNMTKYIAAKLLFSSVIFEMKGETKMVVTFREKGANVKQTTPVEVVQDLLSHCKHYLKEEYGLDFYQNLNSTDEQRA